jgi:hypothetical protein
VGRPSLSLQLIRQARRIKRGTLPIRTYRGSDHVNITSNSQRHRS